MWPCSYDHRELVARPARVRLKPDTTYRKNHAKFKDQQIFNNSIFCTRKLSESTLHAGCISHVCVYRFPFTVNGQLTTANDCVRKKYGQAARLISTSQLKASLLLHTWPIDLVIFQESLGALWLGTSHLVEGFTLRCIQRFSLPDVATRRCHWRDNRYTRGPSNPVLSY